MSDTIDDLLGETLTKIEQFEGCSEHVEEILFYCERGDVYKMYHVQDCCEEVHLNDLCGDLDDLIGSPIIQATCVSNAPTPNSNSMEDGYNSETWTFYIISTVKGTATLRWIGTSNGYYSEEVAFRHESYTPGGNVPTAQ